MSKKNNLWIFADQAMSSGAAFITNVVFIRFFGLVWFGSFTLALILSLLVASIQSATVSSHILTFYRGKKRDERKGYLANMLAIQLITAIPIVLIIFLILKYLIFKELLNNIDPAVLCIYIFSYISIEFFRKAFIAQSRGTVLFSINFMYFSSQAFVIATIVLTKHMVSTNTLLMIYSVILIILSLVAYKTLHIKLTELRRSSFISDVKHFVDFSKWTLPSTLLMWFGESFLMAMLGVYSGTEVVGRVRLIQNLVATIHPIILFLENSISVRYSLLYKDSGVIALYAEVKKNIFMSAIFCFFAAVIAYAIGEISLKLLYGKEYVYLRNYLALYVDSYTFVFCSLFLRAMARTVNQSRLLFRSSFISAILSIASHKYLLENFGDWGFLFGITIFNVSSVLVLALGVKAVKNKTSTVCHIK